MAFEGLAVRPPVAPMLARLTRELPIGDYVYEPKWDGFRAIVFRDGDEVEIQSRHGRPFGRYFPDLVAAIRTLPDTRLVLDGEIVIVSDGRYDFEQLMLRTHPAASRVAALSAAAPATFIAFDLLADGSGSLIDSPLADRRRRLEAVVDDAGAMRLTQATEDPVLAAGWLRRFAGGGVDGVVAKDRSSPYEPGRRSMVKVKLERTADCVVAGFRTYRDGPVASLLLGLYDEAGILRHVGVCSAFSDERRHELLELLWPRAVSLRGHPWETGFGLERSPIGRLKGAAGRWHPGMAMDWMPIAPLVAEVAYDSLDGHRFRHPARFRHWRPDRTPESCTFDQLADVRSPVAVSVS